jgi:hypothetical protein
VDSAETSDSESDDEQGGAVVHKKACSLDTLLIRLLIYGQKTATEYSSDDEKARSAQIQPSRESRALSSADSDADSSDSESEAPPEKLAPKGAVKSIKTTRVHRTHLPAKLTSAKASLDTSSDSEGEGVERTKAASTLTGPANASPSTSSDSDDVLAEAPLPEKRILTKKSTLTEVSSSDEYSSSAEAAPAQLSQKQMVAKQHTHLKSTPGGKTSTSAASDDESDDSQAISSSDSGTSGASLEEDDESKAAPASAKGFTFLIDV